MNRPRSDGAADAADAADVVDAGDPNAVLALTVDPAMATLRVTSPMTPVMQTFVARGRTRDGRMVPVTALWTVSRADVLTIASTGVATTTNTTGGDVVVPSE